MSDSGVSRSEWRLVRALKAELREVEKQYPGGSQHSWELRKKIEEKSGEPATTSEWLTDFLRDVKTGSERVRKIRLGWERASFCLCNMLGRTAYHSKPRLGIGHCSTCGKPAR